VKNVLLKGITQDMHATWRQICSSPFSISFWSVKSAILYAGWKTWQSRSVEADVHSLIKLSGRASADEVLRIAKSRVQHERGI
jgi:hypothetical protein